MKTFRKTTYRFLNPKEFETRAEKYFDFFLVMLIITNVIVLMMDTVQSVHEALGAYLNLFEVISIFIFALEYIFRMWSIVEDPKYKHPVRGRLRFAITPIALIDLLAFLPGLLFLPVDLRFLRLVRIFRIARLFKIVRYVKAIKLMKEVIKERKSELIVSFSLIMIMLVLDSFIMFYAEHDAQPKLFSSVPQTMWWAVATLTTVGYGDVYPITSLGQFLAGVIEMLGIGLFAIPTGIIAAGYIEQLSAKRHQGEICPACGQEIRKH